MPNELLKDLTGLEWLIVADDDPPGGVGICTPEEIEYPDGYSSQADIDATLRYIAKKLAELGYVKVVRCGDCEYGKNYGDCGKWVDIVGKNLDYCSGGERKEAEQ